MMSFEEAVRDSKQMILFRYAVSYQQGSIDKDVFGKFISTFIEKFKPEVELLYDEESDNLTVYENERLSFKGTPRELSASIYTITAFIHMKQTPQTFDFISKMQTIVEKLWFENYKGDFKDTQAYQLWSQFKEIMYCPSCGKEIPERSQFCLSCGKPINISTTTPKAITNWEYKDYIYEFSKVSPIRVSDEFPPDRVRQEIWAALKSEIEGEINDEQVKGWQPAGEVSPSCIELNGYVAGTEVWDGSDWVFFALAGAISWGLLWLILPFTRKYSVVVPLRFKLRMRRPKA